MAKVLPIKPQSFLTKVVNLLDEGLALVREARCYIQERRARERREGVDLFGPNGTEMRFNKPANIAQPVPGTGGARY
jgi:hypothetical protein